MKNDFTCRITGSKVWEVVSQLGGSIEDHKNSTRKCLLLGDNRRAQDH
jgi:hypothetical protein